MPTVKQILDVAFGLELPVDFIAARASLVGMSGAGKSNALRVMIEAVYDIGAPFVLADPFGASYGLRSSADGLKPGLSVPIFGGYHSDEGLPLNAKSGRLVARELYHADLSAILDLSAMNGVDSCTFIADFNEELFALHMRRKKLRAYFADEAAMLMPEKATNEADYRSMTTFVTLHRGGRAQGIGLKTAVQGSASQAKESMKQSELFIALRTMAPLDQKPIVDYLRASADKKQAEEVRQTLSHLEDGEAWFLAPRWLGAVKRGQFHLSRTFDSSYTPKLGEIAIEPKVLAAVDMARIREAIQREEVAAEVPASQSGDPQRLHRRIAELEAQLADARLAPAPTEPEHVEVAVQPPQHLLQDLKGAIMRAQMELQHYQGLVDRVRESIVNFDEMKSDWTGIVAPIANAFQKLTIHDVIEDHISLIGGGELHPSPAPQTIPTITPPSRRPRQTVTVKEAGDKPVLQGIPAGAATLVETLARRYPMSLSEKQLSVFSGRSLKSSAWAPNLKAARDSGLIEIGRTGDYVLTELGLKLYKIDPHQKQDPAELRSMWRRVLPVPAQKMLDELASGRKYDRLGLAAKVGISTTSSGVDQGISALRKNGLLDERDGRLALAAYLL